MRGCPTSFVGAVIAVGMYVCVCGCEPIWFLKLDVVFVCLYLSVSLPWFHPFFSRSCGSCCFSCAPSFMTAVVSSVVLIFLVGFRLALSSCAWRRSRSGVTSRPVSLCWAGRLLMPDCSRFRLRGAASSPISPCVRARCHLKHILPRGSRRGPARAAQRERHEHRDREHFFDPFKSRGSN